MTQQEAVAQLNSELSGIMDQALKNQWWNVISRLHRVMLLAITRFDTVLKENN